MTNEQPIQKLQLFDTMVSRRQAIKWVTAGTTLGISGMLIGPRHWAAAQASPATGATTYPQVAITAQDFQFGVESTVPIGYVEVTLTNHSPDMSHHAMFMRPNQGVTAEEFMTKTKATANFGDVLKLAKSAGGPGSVDPGQTSTVIMHLDEGPYVLICTIPGPGGKPHYQLGMMAAVQAKASGTAVTNAPTAETTVDLVDFAFKGLPKTVSAGQHIWKVTNSGPEPHEMAIFSLAPGMTTADAFKALEALVAPPSMASPGASPAASPVAGPPPLVDVAGVAPMSPGETNWAVLNLKPGDYVSACFVPDPATGKPHFMLGMFMGFAVQ